MLQTLSFDADMGSLSLDSTCIKIHENPNEGKIVNKVSGGDWTQNCT